MVLFLLSCLVQTFDYPGSSLALRTRIKTLAYNTILANARFFNNDISAVPHMALTVGVGTVLESREILIVVTGLKKSLALSKAIGAFFYLVYYRGRSDPKQEHQDRRQRTHE